MTTPTQLSTDIISGPTPELKQQFNQLVAEVAPPRLGLDKTTSSITANILKDYYVPMRWAGYTFSATVASQRDRLAKPLADKMLAASEKQLNDFFADGNFVEHGNLTNKIKSEAKNKAEMKVARFEAGAFFTLTAIYAFLESKDINKNIGAAVAAELGKPMHELSGMDYFRSKNPIVQTGAHRFSLKTGFRAASDASFLGGMIPGLLANAVRITLERSIFNTQTAYDRLDKMMGNVQTDNFDVHAEDKIARELANIIQQSQKDHGRKGWDRKLLRHYEPVFSQMADEIVAKRMGMPEVTYLFGEMMVKQLTPKQSMREFEKVRDKGLRVIGYKDRFDAMEATTPTPNTKIPSKVVSFAEYAQRSTDSVRGL